MLLKGFPMNHSHADPIWPDGTFNADQDPAFDFNADSGIYPAFRFDVDLDPDPAPLQSDRNLWPLVYRPPVLHFEPPGFHCERPRLYFEPLKLLNFD